MKNHRPVTKAVIAAAGYGTRFLPATKNQPKQMLSIIEKPIIHYVVEEAAKSGIKDIILVTQSGQHIMEDYFDNSNEIENYLKENGKDEYLEMVREIPKMANFIYVRQRKHLPYGNGTPILSAMSLIDDDEAFVYYFADDLTIPNKGESPITKQLIDVYNEHRPDAILAVQEVPDSDVEKYGTVKYKDNPDIPNEIDGILEKMPLGENYSNMAQFGRFVLSYEVVKNIQETALGKGGELWLTDVLNKMAEENKKVLAQPVKGEWLTTGDPLNYVKATFKFALERDDLKDDLLEYIKELSK